MEFEVPKKHIIRPTLSTNMVQRVLLWDRQKRCYIGRKRQGPMAEKYCSYNKNLMNFFEEEKMKERDDQKKMNRLGDFLKKKLPFFNIY